ncbi:MAG: flap endonuclease-1 [Thaumarchaeota archaeon]|nr:flap endonuclease-1 [Nitrososphaerota archaeon]
MGLDLGNIVTREKIELQQLTGWKLAVDAYNTLYQFLAIIRGASGEHLKDSHGRVTSHLSGLFYRNINLMELGIKLVFVFDGKPPELKTQEIQRRSAQRREAQVQYTKAIEVGDIVAARKYAEASTSLRGDMVKESKALLETMGIPWVDAPSEGEAQASVMAAEGTVNAVASQDHDSLIFGAPILVRNVTISGKRRLPSKGIVVNVQPERITLADVYGELQLTREQLVDLAILLGTDFNPDGFEGIGPATALKHIRKYGRLEDIPDMTEELSKINYNAIRHLFLEPPCIKGIKPEWKPVDKQRIYSFLVEEHSFSRDRVQAALNRLKNVESAQTETLERWFG